MKNILLTGASRGLGLQMCKTFLEKGWTVYATSRTASGELQKLGDAFSGKLFFKSAELASPDSARRELFAEDFVSNKVRLDGLVNNAAIAYDDLATNANEAELEKLFKVNVIAPILLSKYAIRNFIFNKQGGSLVHISSISAHTGYKGLSMYAASKGALEAFSKNLAREWGVRGVRSNCIVAGFMQTDMSASLTQEQRAKIYERTSLKRATNANSVAETTAFLLSDAANSITAQNYFVDSGTI